MNNVICFLLSVAYMQVVHCSSNVARSGTHLNLSSIIIGRCLEYKRFSDLNRNENFKVSVSCGDVWKEFSKAFAYRDICNVTEKDYDGLFGLLQDTGKSNQILFWSGTKEIAHDFSGVNDNYVTLEDTFPGYIADQLRWCGCNDGARSCDGGIGYQSCNTKCDDGRAFLNEPYWQRASKALAVKASGTAYVIVNGTQRGYFTAYWTGSIFGKSELPRLGRLKQVTKLVILVALDLHMKPKEKCGQGTLIQLVDDAKRYGISDVECNDNPVMVLGILCAKYPRADLCMASKKEKKAESSGLTDTSIVFIVLFALFLVTTVVLGLVLYKVWQMRRQSYESSEVPNTTTTEKQSLPMLVES